MHPALVVGKFYPPHIGHHKLIDTALAENEHVIVAVCHSSVENIPVEDRVAWLKAEHPTAEFIEVYDDTPVEYTDETWEWFLDSLMDSLDRPVSFATYRDLYPGIIYSGEDYAPEFARRLDERYDRRMRDMDAFPELVTYRLLDRMELPVSASLFRSNPPKAWELLRPAAKAGLCKRIVVCGAESSGSTTLARALAFEYETTVVPEYGREFDWAVGKHHTWTDADFVHIALWQYLWEAELAKHSRKGLLICDTDEFATAMFSEIYLGQETPGVREIAEATPADLYIITGSEIPFVDDGTRFNSGRREWMTDWFRENLPEGRWVFVKGPEHYRLMEAIHHVDRLLSDWGIEEPLEYRNEAAK